jgi:hypothetical protein
VSKDPKEYGEFSAIIGDHFAPLSVVTARFTSRLNAQDRDFFIEQLLEMAWERRERINPEKQSLIRFWDDCCIAVARIRKEWTIWYSHGPKVIKWRQLGL